MQHLTSEDGSTIILRLDDGDLLLESLQELASAEDLDCAVIVTGFGALKRTHIHVGEWDQLPPKNKYIVWEAPVELCSLTGLIVDGQVHAHITVSDGEKTIGGHLEPESVVLYLNEIVLHVIPGLKLTREMSPEGLPILGQPRLAAQP